MVLTFVVQLVSLVGSVYRDSQKGTDEAYQGTEKDTILPND